MTGTVTNKKWKAWDEVSTTTLECKSFHESVQWQLTTHFCCRSLKTELTKDWFLHTNVSCTYRQSTDYTSHTVAAAVSITRQISALNAVSYTSANGSRCVKKNSPLPRVANPFSRNILFQEFKKSQNFPWSNISKYPRKSRKYFLIVLWNTGSLFYSNAITIFSIVP